MKHKNSSTNINNFFSPFTSQKNKKNSSRNTSKMNVCSAYSAKKRERNIAMNCQFNSDENGKRNSIDC